MSAPVRRSEVVAEAGVQKTMLVTGPAEQGHYKLAAWVREQTNRLRLFVELREYLPSGGRVGPARQIGLKINGRPVGFDRSSVEQFATEKPGNIYVLGERTIGTHTVRPGDSIELTDPITRRVYRLRLASGGRVTTALARLS